MTGVTTVAAFDVDGTVTDRDCVVPFMRRVTGARRIVPRLARPTRSTRHRCWRGAIATSSRRSRQPPPFGVGGTTTWPSSASRSPAPSTTGGFAPTPSTRSERHLASGDRVVLVSASFEVYLRPLGELFGVARRPRHPAAARRRRRHRRARRTELSRTREGSPAPRVARRRVRGTGPSPSGRVRRFGRRP